MNHLNFFYRQLPMLTADNSQLEISAPSSRPYRSSRNHINDFYCTARVAYHRPDRHRLWSFVPTLFTDLTPTQRAYGNRPCVG